MSKRPAKLWLTTVCKVTFVTSNFMANIFRFKRQISRVVTEIMNI